MMSTLTFTVMFMTKHQEQIILELHLHTMFFQTELSFFMFHQPKKSIPIGTFNAMTWSSVSVKQKLMDERLNLTLNVSDPFAMSGFGFSFKTILGSKSR